MSLPTKQIAKLGLMLGQAKRRKRGYVMLPVDEAQAIHDYLRVVRNLEYIKEYRKL